MKKTNIAVLVAIGGFFAAATLILVHGFYGILGPVPISVAIALWTMATLCVILGIVVKDRVEENRVGLDRTQLNPLRAWQYMVFGKTCAFMGAIFGGVYVGFSIYVLPRMSTLVAAEADAPRVAAAALGGIALAVAGLWLENACSVPPPTDLETVG